MRREIGMVQNEGRREKGRVESNGILSTTSQQGVAIRRIKGNKTERRMEGSRMYGKKEG